MAQCVLTLESGEQAGRNVEASVDLVYVLRTKAVCGSTCGAGVCIRKVRTGRHGKGSLFGTDHQDAG